MLSNKALFSVFLALAGLSEGAPTQPKIPGGRFLSNSNSRRLTPQQAIDALGGPEPILPAKRQLTPDQIPGPGTPFDIPVDDIKRQAPALTLDHIGQIIADSQDPGSYPENVGATERDLTPEQIEQIEQAAASALEPEPSPIKRDLTPEQIAQLGQAIDNSQNPFPSADKRDDFEIVAPEDGGFPVPYFPPRARRDDFEITDPEDGGFPVPYYPPRAKRTFKVWQS